MKPSSIIIVTLIIVNFFTAGWLIYEKLWPAEFVNSYPLLDIARNFIAQENFIVNIQPLREELNTLIKQEGEDSTSLYFEFLNTGANIQINPNLPVWPASLLKVPMAMVVMKKIEKGEWSLDSELVLFEEDKGVKYGTLWMNPVGTRFTVEELLREILINSDNTAYNIFLRNINSQEILDIMSEVGLEDLFTEEGFVSAKEYSRLFRALYVSSFLKRESSEKILRWLSESEFKEYLSTSLPSDVRFSHKFGIDTEKYAYIDSGIIYVPNRPYLITVGIKGTGAPGEEENVKKLMQEIGKKAYVYISNYGN